MSRKIVRTATIVMFSVACAPARTDVPTVPPDSDFDIAVGAIARMANSDLVVRFDTVTEDSRCPQDVTCVWEGNATALLTLDSAGKTMLARFTTSQPEPLRGFGWTFELRALRPARTSQAPPQPADYVITLRASR